MVDHDMRKTKRFGTRNEYIVVALVLMSVLGVMGKVAPWKAKTVKRIPTVTPMAQSVPKVRRMVDGILVDKGQENPPLAGVMQENMVEAQPLSGIASASLVFEAVTEANITRFLAYYNLDDAPRLSEIGPIRSARAYYLNWAAEFQTLYGHVGSSPEAYNLLRGAGMAGVRDLDQWYQSQYYKRVGNRPAPHNVYTSGNLLKQAYQSVVISLPLSVRSWKFKADAPPDSRGNVVMIKVAYVAPYAVEWQYDKVANQYARRQWGGPHKDAAGKVISAKNIAVAFEKMEVLDALGRKKFTTIGEGKGLVFQDGRVIVGKWKKPSAPERMRWYDGQGQEVELNAGTTWVEIVPEGYKVGY